MKIMVANRCKIRSVLGVRTVGLGLVTGRFSVMVRVRDTVRDTVSIRVSIGFRTDLVRVWVRTFDSVVSVVARVCARVGVM